MKKEAAIKEKMTAIVIEQSIPGIIETIRKGTSSKEHRFEVIGEGFVAPDYEGLCLVYKSPFTGDSQIYMAIDPLSFATKPTTKRGEEPAGYLSIVVRANSECYALRFKGKEYQI